MNLPTTAAAAVASKGQTCTVEEIPVPSELRGGALVQVEVAAVCGTDRSHLRDDAFFDDRGRVILGHENVGRVLAIDPAGAARWGVEAGTRVIVEETIPCGACGQCRDGAGHRCPATDFRNPDALRYGRTAIDVWPGLWGGFSEILYVHPRATLHTVPEELPGHVAAFFNPVANGLRWLIDVAGTRPGDEVLVIGPGSHGLGCVLAAAALKTRVTIAGVAGDESRLADGQRLGASSTVRIDAPDAHERIIDATRGGPDVVIDLAPGATEPLELAVKVARVGGRLILAGHKGDQTAALDTDEILRKELNLHGVRGPNRRAIDSSIAVLAAHQDAVGSMTTRRVGLDGVCAALLATSRDQPAAHVVVEPATTTQTNHQEDGQP